MTQITVTRTIDAPIETVFKTVADIREFPKAVPAVVNVEILSEVQSGLGARFRETRLFGGKEAAEEFEVTEYVENDRIRLVTDSHGTVWDSVFQVSREDQATRLTLTMNAKAYKLLPKLINPLMKGMIQSAVGKDMDSIKSYCEQAATDAESQLPPREFGW